MLSFRTWLRAAEHSRSDLTEGKKKHRPDNRVDDFLDQLIGLAGDMDKASKTKPAPLPTKPTVKASPGEEQLLSLAKVALANLRSSPDYYKTRAADLKAGGNPANNNGKVTRDDAIRAARELGVDFRNVEFDQETFRKGIEAEFNRTSAFSRDYTPEKKVV
jgi:hypothetical protein